MATTPSFDLASQSRFGLRFAAPEAEKAYRAWRNEQVIPAIRLTQGIGIASNLTAVMPGYLWWPGFNWFGVFVLHYVLLVPVGILVIIVTYTRARRLATVLAALTLAQAGSVLIWNMFVGTSRIIGSDTTGPAMAFAIMSAFFGLMNRLPPVLAMTAITPFMLPAILVAMHRGQTGAIPAIQAYPYLFSASLSYLIVGIMSVVSERSLRKAFVNEQLLARQTLDMERSRNLIRRYVPPALVDHIIAGSSTAVTRRSAAGSPSCSPTSWTSPPWPTGWSRR